MVPTGPVILTSRFDVRDGYTYDGYVRTGGYVSLRTALTEMAPADVAAQVKDATLLGRGGAGFPAGVKWSFLPPNAQPYYVVINGDESEPGTYKDRLLMELDPHQLIEGVVLCCYAVGAVQGFLYVRGEMALAQERLAQALTDAYAHGIVGKNIMGTGGDIDVGRLGGAAPSAAGEGSAARGRLNVTRANARPDCGIVQWWSSRG